MRLALAFLVGVSTTAGGFPAPAAAAKSDRCPVDLDDPFEYPAED